MRSHVNSLFTDEEQKKKLAHDVIDTSATHLALFVTSQTRTARHEMTWQRSRPCFRGFATVDFLQNEVIY